MNILNLPQVKGRLEKDYSLKKLNTWRIGGQAETVFWPENSNELLDMLNWCQQNSLPIVLLGRGSNVLLPDKGLRGMVIVTTKIDSINWQEDRVQVGAGYSLIRLASEAALRGLQGLEFACGIPGTIGAGIAINAGAHGGEIGNLVEEVKVLTAEGKILELNGEEIKFSYRDSSLVQNGYWVLESTIRLKAGGKSSDIREKMKTLKYKRRQTQPLEYPNAGSIFRNPPGHSAGQLIEQAGWKGYRLGEAEVSEKHANFIINKGNAKADDVLELISIVQQDIKDKYGLVLETEVKIVNS